MSATGERPVQAYFEVFGLGAKDRVSSLKLTFSSYLVSLLLRWKTVSTDFVVLSFINFLIWRYFPFFAMSLLSILSIACQSPSACMIARSLAYASLLKTVFGKSEV